MKFEEAMTQLEETVKKLESGEVTLEESMELFEKGVKLSRTCQKLLGDAQLKVTQLLAESDKEVDFDTENL
ncbi:MAG: exodeoxyribonuclease VII small subunit [Ruminococcaceae bacterium]|nr:exodeoxyribonuclease VII small subunit [Oscillospiraceae bacterium]